MKLATIPRRHPRWLVAVMLAVMVVIVLNGFAAVRSRQVPGLPWLGSDAGHDWLLVVEDRADRLTVYDAGDGRPLRQLDAGTAAAAAMLGRHDGRVFVIAAEGTRNEAASPQSQRIAASGR
jgi:hypothetical protein